MILSVFGPTCQLTTVLVIRSPAGVIFGFPQVLSGGRDMANWQKAISLGPVCRHPPRNSRTSPIGFLPQIPNTYAT